MSFIYTEFDGVSLPVFNHDQTHDSMPMETALLGTIGNAFDWVGTERRRGRKQTIALTGEYMGETTYFDDGEDGASSGDDALIWGDAYESFAASVTGLLGKRGVRGPLWRTYLLDDSRQWKTARLMNVNWPRAWEDHAIKGKLSCVFETTMDGWRAENETELTKNLSADGFEYTWIVGVDSELTINDAVITITRGSGTITSVYISAPDLGIDLAFTGLATAIGSLIIDCGAQTMRHSNGTDIYSYFALGAGHTARGWCPLPPGTHQFNMTVNGGTAIATIAFYPQMA